MTVGRGYVAIPIEARPEVARQYRAGMSLVDLAVERGVSSSAIRTALVAHGVKLRSKAPLDKHGPGLVGDKNPRWAGDRANYSARHQRVKYARGSASQYPCQHCGTDDGSRYEWAQIHGTTGQSPDDYMPLCETCHEDYDARISREQAEEIRALRYFGVPRLTLAAMYDCTGTTITNICNTRTRKRPVTGCSIARSLT